MPYYRMISKLVADFEYNHGCKLTAFNMHFTKNQVAKLKLRLRGSLSFDYDLSINYFELIYAALDL